MNNVSLDSSAFGTPGNGGFNYNVNWHVDWSCSGMPQDTSLCAICCGSAWFKSATKDGTYSDMFPGTSGFKQTNAGQCGSNYTTTGVSTLTNLDANSFYQVSIWAAPCVSAPNGLVCDGNTDDYTQSSTVSFSGSGP